MSNWAFPSLGSVVWITGDEIGVPAGKWAVVDTHLLERMGQSAVDSVVLHALPGYGGNAGDGSGLVVELDRQMWRVARDRGAVEVTDAETMSVVRGYHADRRRQSPCSGGTP